MGSMPLCCVPRSLVYTQVSMADGEPECDCCPKYPLNLEGNQVQQHFIVAEHEKSKLIFVVIIPYGIQQKNAPNPAKAHFKHLSRLLYAICALI